MPVINATIAAIFDEIAAPLYIQGAIRSAWARIPATAAIVHAANAHEAMEEA